jgi:hypothetical protein
MLIGLKYLKSSKEVRDMGLLDIILILLILSWLGGFALHVGGGLIHLLLVIALIVFIARLLGIAI